jgi:hypothetical protein
MGRDRTLPHIAKLLYASNSQQNSFFAILWQEQGGIVGIPSIRLKEIAKAGSVGVLTGALAGDDAVRAEFRVRLVYLSSIPRLDWNKKQFRYLKKGVFEIKWTSGKVEWRALGFDSGGYFVVVRCCTHKQNVYSPADCIDRAIKLKAEVQSGFWETKEYEL